MHKLLVIVKYFMCAITTFIPPYPLLIGLNRDWWGICTDFRSIREPGPER